MLKLLGSIILFRLWRESSLNGSLTDEKPLTAFIPSDDSFSNNEFKKLLSTPKLADVFVRRYIVEGEQLWWDG